MALYKLGRLEETLEAFEAAALLSDDPDNPQTALLQQRGSILIALQRLPEAWTQKRDARSVLSKESLQCAMARVGRDPLKAPPVLCRPWPCCRRPSCTGRRTCGRGTTWAWACWTSSGGTRRWRASMLASLCSPRMPTRSATAGRCSTSWAARTSVLRPRMIASAWLAGASCASEHTVAKRVLGRCHAQEAFASLEWALELQPNHRDARGKLDAMLAERSADRGL